MCRSVTCICTALDILDQEHNELHCCGFPLLDHTILQRFECKLQCKYFPFCINPVGSGILRTNKELGGSGSPPYEKQ